MQGNAEFQAINPKPKLSCATSPKLAERGDFLLSVRAPVGATNVADQRYGIGRGLCAIRPNTSVHRRYLWWAMHAVLPLLRASSVGSTYDAVTADVVGALPIPLPSRLDQERIARHLDSEVAFIDEMISKKRHLYGLLEARLISRAQDSVIGGRGTQPTDIPSIPVIPTSWRVLRNKVFTREVSARTSDGTGEMLTVSHISGITPRSEKTVYMFEAESTEGYKIVKPGNLVINTMWAWMGAAGVSDVEGIVSPAYGVYEFDPRIMMPYYFDILVRTPAYVAEMTRFSRGVTSSRLRLYPDEFLALRSPVPEMSVQQSIVEQHYSYQRKNIVIRQKITEQIELLRDRRQALIDAAIMPPIGMNVQGQ